MFIAPACSSNPLALAARPADGSKSVQVTKLSNQCATQPAGRSLLVVERLGFPKSVILTSRISRHFKQFGLRKAKLACHQSGTLFCNCTRRSSKGRNLSSSRKSFRFQLSRNAASSVPLVASLQAHFKAKHETERAEEGGRYC